MEYSTDTSGLVGVLEVVAADGLVLDELAPVSVDCFDDWPAVTSIDKPGLVPFDAVVEDGFGEVDLGVFVADWFDAWPVVPTTGTHGSVCVLEAVDEVGVVDDGLFDWEAAGDEFEALLAACSDGCPTFTSTETFGLGSVLAAVVAESALEAFACVGKP